MRRWRQRRGRSRPDGNVQPAPRRSGSSESPCGLDLTHSLRTLALAQYSEQAGRQRALITTIPSAALVPTAPVLTDDGRLALAGLLAVLMPSVQESELSELLGAACRGVFESENGRKRPHHVCHAPDLSVVIDLDPVYPFALPSRELALETEDRL